MSKVITTDWKRVSPGQTTQLDLTQISRYLSARVRWRGADNTYDVYATYQSEASYPGIQGGSARFIRHIFNASWMVENVSATESASYYIKFNTGAGGVQTRGPYTLPPLGSTTASVYENNIQVYMPGTAPAMWIEETPSVSKIWTTGYTKSCMTEQAIPVIQQTVNPSVTVAGHTTYHSGTLADGAVTDWYTLGGLTKGVNSLSHSLGNINSRVDIQLEYIIEPLLPYTEQTQPEHSSSTTETTVDFIFVLIADSDNSADTYHARIRFANYSTMPSVTVFESKEDQTSWSYLSGGVWTAFPAEGVPPGATVRYTRTFILSTVYWDTASWDGYVYGRQSTPFKVRLVLSTEALYTLDIGGIRYDALFLNAVETSNGEIGGISVVVDNTGGAAYADISFGDILIMAVSHNGAEDFEAVIREKNPQGDDLELTAVMGDGVLAERLVKEDYPEQDIGLTVAAIITSYCAPLTAAHVDTNTGFIAPTVADGKSPLAVLEEMRRNYGLHYFVDKNWDLHFYKADAVSKDATIWISYGEG